MRCIRLVASDLLQREDALEARRARAAAVLAIADALGHQTTAEGVETTAQLDYLRRSRCDFGQSL